MFESIWLKSHVPGAYHLPFSWNGWDVSEPKMKRLQEITLGEIVEKNEEVVFYWCAEHILTCTGAWEAARAVSWGYQKVYYMNASSLREWMKAGYSVDSGE